MNLDIFVSTPAPVLEPQDDDNNNNNTNMVVKEKSSPPSSSSYQPPRLSFRDIQVFNLLEHPIWLFNITKRSMVWANKAGIELWDASCLEELQARSFQEMSESTVTRLNDYHTNFFTRGEKVRDEIWTYYPNGIAKTVRVTLSWISLLDNDNNKNKKDHNNIMNIGGGGRGGGGDIIMLNEGTYINEKEIHVKDALWGVEMLRHLPVSVTQFDIHGNVMYQNPEALETFGNPNNTASSTHNHHHHHQHPHSSSHVATTNNKNRSKTTTTTTSPQVNNKEVPVVEAAAEEDGKEEVVVAKIQEMEVESNRNNLDSIDTKKKKKLPDLLARFVDKELGEQVLRDVQDGKTVSVEANQFITAQHHHHDDKNGSAAAAGCHHHRRHHPRHYSSHHNKNQQWSALKLRRAKDPVTSQPVILYSARDITDIVEAKREREVAGRKSEFLAIMAHEIRTPLHQVMGYIDLLAQTELDLEQRSFVKLLQSSSRALMVVISDVLDYTKLEAGKMKLECIPFEPQEVLQASMDAVRQSYDSKNLTLDLELDKNIPFRVLGDSNRLRQVLLNLLSNAQKFTSDGGVHIQVRNQDHGCVMNPTTTETGGTSEEQQPQQRRRCTTSTGTHRGVLTFSVRDTGIGINDKDVIFEEYQQANSSIARNFGGTGLGLSICKKLVENMGGSIGLESELGKGSTFWFTLPYETPPEEEMDNDEDTDDDNNNNTNDQSSSSLNKQTKKRRSGTGIGSIGGGATNHPPSTKGLNILVAEDNLVNQKLVASMLRRTGHTSKIVENGKEAVDEIHKGETKYDLILMDLQMPVMDGYEATSWLRSRGYTDIPIYALTASIQRADFEELGFNDWIGKPIPMKKFKEKLHRLQQCHALTQQLGGRQQNATISPLCSQ